MTTTVIRTDDAKLMAALARRHSRAETIKLLGTRWKVAQVVRGKVDGEPALRAWLERVE